MNFDKVYSLKRILFTIVIFFTIIIPILIALLFSFNLYQTQLENIKHNQMQVLKQVNLETNSFMHDIETIASYIRKYYSDENNDLLKKIVHINSTISTVIILDSKGYIEDFYADHALSIYKGYDFSKKVYYKMIDRGRDTYWSDLFLSSVNMSQSLTYSFKMDDKIGVIFLDLSHISQFIKRFVNSDKSHVIRVYDSDGVLILNPDKTHLQSQKEYSVFESVFVDLIHKYSPFEQNIYEDEESHQKDIGMYDTIEGTGWYILARENFDNILSRLLVVFVEISVVTLIAIALLLFIIYKFVSRLFISLDNLEKVTAHIAQGEYNTPVEKTVFRELNSLVYGLQHMQQEIEKREEVLEKSINNFKKLVDSTMEGIIIVFDERCQNVNKVALQLLGYENKEDLVGKKIISLFNKKDANFVLSHLNKEFEAIEIELIKKDQSSIIALIQSKVFEMNNEHIQLIAIIDISEIKEKENLLFHQSKMAALGEMIGNISHQWRQPLSTISTAASGMKFQKEYGVLEDKEFYNNMDLICNTTQYLSGTIDDFRSFLNVNKQSKDFNLQKAITRSVSLIESSLKNNFIILEMHLEENIMIDGYENEFIQAFINILNNAKDALKNKKESDDKVIVITLEKKNDKAIIKVQDSGGGIPIDIMPKIFEPYFTTKHQSQGTGIGLYMTHQILCDHMKATIVADNEIFHFHEKQLTGALFKIEFKI